MRDDVYRTIERLNHERELFSRLLAKKYRAMAYFGKEAAAPFHELKDINDRIVRAAMLMIPRVGSTDQVSPKLWGEWETDLGWRSDPMVPDDLAKQIEAVVASVEKVYGGWLKRGVS